MNFSNVASVMQMTYQYQNRTQKISGREQVNSFQDVLESKSAALADTAGTEETSGTEKVSLESMLKAKYPNLVYNVGDGTSSAWRTRNDYPFEAVFQEGESAIERIENWKPTGVNPKNQRYMPVAPNSKAVMIHPKAQERMENEPEFAQEVMERIESWFEFDIARNEAISPGCTIGMSQAIVIGEDGEIANVVSIGAEDSVGMSNHKKDDEEDAYDWWLERLARHALYMKLWSEDKTNINLDSFSLMGGGTYDFFGGSSMNGMLAMQSGQAAELEVRRMQQNGLKEKLGDTIAGVSTDDIINGTWADIEKGRSMRMSLMMM